MNKKVVFFKNSKDYLTDQDYSLFESVVGNSIDNIENKIKNWDSKIINNIYSNMKFVDHESLNAEGLHIYRTILSNRVYLNRKSTTSKEVEQFVESGFLVIEDFLEETEFSNLRNLFVQKIKPKKSDNYITRVDGTQFLKRNTRLQTLIKHCAKIDNFLFDQPRVEFWNLIHESNDPQSKFHSDTFHPTCKFWLFLEDIDETKGPFVYVPKSNSLSLSRLKWDYENSTMKRNTELWNKRIQLGGKPGSFRVYENSTSDEENLVIKNMGYQVKPIIGKKNTLVAANTFGFHKRGFALPKTSRETLSIEYRPQAFWKY